MGNPLDNPTLSLSMTLRQAELKSSHGCDRPEGREMLHRETALTHTTPVEHTYTHTLHQPAWFREYTCCRRQADLKARFRRS